MTSIFIFLIIRIFLHNLIYDMLYDDDSKNIWIDFELETRGEIILCDEDLGIFIL